MQISFILQNFDDLLARSGNILFTKLGFQKLWFNLYAKGTITLQKRVCYATKSVTLEGTTVLNATFRTAASLTLC